MLSAPLRAMSSVAQAAVPPPPRPAPGGPWGGNGAAHRDRPHRNCVHDGYPPPHGPRLAYVKDACRCLHCPAANSAASRARYRQQALGRWQPFTDASPVRAHLAALRAAGVGIERIAQLTGLSLSHLRVLASTRPNGGPPTPKVRPDTAARILAVNATHAARAPRSQVCARGTHHRLQALARLGWSIDLLADQLGRRPANLRRSMTGHTVTAHTARTVADLYARLELTAPPENTAEGRAAADAVRREAAMRGWPPPLA